MQRLLLALPLLLQLPALAIGLRALRSATEVLHLVHARTGPPPGSNSTSGNASLPTVFCFSVARPGKEAELMLLHLHVPMLAACDGYAIFSNVSSQELMGNLGAVALARDSHRGLFNQSVNGSMDVPMDGYPHDHPKVYSAANTPIFKQAWKAIFARDLWRSYDWVVKVDPDTVIFPDRLRTILAARDPREKELLFDGGDLCPTGMGGLAILSRGVMEPFAAFHDFFLNLPIVREDGLLSGGLVDIMKARVGKEPNLVLNPVIFGCHTAWKAAYHPFKDVGSASLCLKAAPYAKPPTAEQLHTKCT